MPTIPVLTQLADVLGVSAAELLGERPKHETARVRTAAGDAIYQALTNPLPPCDERPALPVLRRRVHDAWSIWQTSPHRYSQTTARLPVSIADTELAVRAVGASGQAGEQRAHLGCAADLYGPLRTVAKRIGRVDLSLLAADRALRCAEAADDPLRLAAAHWNMAQVLLADGEPQAAEAVAMKAAERLQPAMSGSSTDVVAHVRLGDLAGSGCSRPSRGRMDRPRPDTPRGATGEANR